MIEFTYQEPGRFMFHAHQSEFVELGWMSMFGSSSRSSSSDRIRASSSPALRQRLTGARLTSSSISHDFLVRR